MRKRWAIAGILILMWLGAAGCASDEDKKAEYLKSGRAYLDKGDYRAAEIEFKNAVQIDPEDAEAYIGLGTTYLKLGNAAMAYRAYSSAANLEPENLDIQARLGTFLLLADQLDAAAGKAAFVL